MYRDMYKEIEEIFIEHPDVADVCVIAMRSTDHTPQAGACVVLRRNAENSEESLSAYCRDRLPDVAPVQIRILPALPRSRTGMVSRKDLLPLFLGDR
jgi:acyl-CoA synthetase (AMP-forming)/AMP-acid ligase II